MTRRLQKGDTAYQPIGNLPSASQPKNETGRKKWRMWILLLALLLLLGIVGWFCASSGLFPMGLAPDPAFTSSPTESAPQPVQPTQTLPDPSETPTDQQSTSTVTVTATSTATAAPTVSSTPTATVTVTIAPSATTPSTPKPTSESILGVPTIKYPEGNNLTLFWNETSFVMLNRSRAARSLSGFTFERLDANDQPTKVFPGYRWETHKFKYIPSKNCVSIKSYKDEDPPYVDPADCLRLYSSILQPTFEEEPETLFWLPQDGETQFRVLWLKEEVARCEISAGTCEIYIP